MSQKKKNVSEPRTHQYNKKILKKSTPTSLKRYTKLIGRFVFLMEDTISDAKLARTRKEHDH